MSDTVSGGGVFYIQCFNAEGDLKWEHKEHNLVVNAGLQDMNAKYFTGVSYTAAWYIGLWGTAASNNPAASDTMGSHPGWTEFTNYGGSRPAVTFGTAGLANPSTISNALAPAMFTITGAGGTVGGAFLTTDSTKGGTSGLLFSGADFNSPGDRIVIVNDIIVVTYSFSLTAT